MIVRPTNSPRFFFSTARSRSSRAPKADRLALTAERLGSDAMVGGRGAVTVVISRAGPFR